MSEIGHFYSGLFFDLLTYPRSNRDGSTLLFREKKVAHTINNATTTTAVKNEDIVDDTVMVEEWVGTQWTQYVSLILVTVIKK